MSEKADMWIVEGKGYKVYFSEEEAKRSVKLQNALYPGLNAWLFPVKKLSIGPSNESTPVAPTRDELIGALYEAKYRIDRLTNGFVTDIIERDKAMETFHELRQILERLGAPSLNNTAESDRAKCPRCYDLFYDPKTLIECEKQRAAEWEEIAKRAEAERDELKNKLARLMQGPQWRNDEVQNIIEERNAFKKKLEFATKALKRIHDLGPYKIVYSDPVSPEKALHTIVDDQRMALAAIEGVE